MQDCIAFKAKVILDLIQGWHSPKRTIQLVTFTSHDFTFTLDARKSNWQHIKVKTQQSFWRLKKKKKTPLKTPCKQTTLLYTYQKQTEKVLSVESNK